MKLKDNFFYTLRDDVKDEDSISSNLLTRAGMIKRSSSGVYIFLPLGLKVLKNIENIIREEMNNINSLEVSMPSLIASEYYEKSGRIAAFGDSVFKLNDRYNRDYVLGPTHEELFAIAALNKSKSYKDLPFSLYQFQTKFRDEARPRYGLIRVREFVMKDAYTFDKDLEGLDKSYNEMKQAYNKLFDCMHINYKVVTADVGVMGGLLSEEYQAITDIGEDILVLCKNCDYASNLEISPYINDYKDTEEELELEKVYTPNCKTVEELKNLTKINIEKIVKALMFNVDGEVVICFVRGDKEVNLVKLSKLLDAINIELATEEEILNNTNAVPGFTGPIGLNCKVVVDSTVLTLKNFVTGANETDYHIKNVNLKDFRYDISGDIVNIDEGDKCPECGGKTYFNKGIEIGNIFKLGTKYSEKLGLNYLDHNNKLIPVVMGSYGIGLGRCMAAIVEQNNDEKGIIWPEAVAPFKVCIVTANIKDEVQLKLSKKLYDILSKNNIEVLLDDRDERLGVKLNDMDLIGIPIRILVGKKAKGNIIELKYRNETETKEIPIYRIFNILDIHK